jgi:hypothetical protein
MQVKLEAKVRRVTGVTKHYISTIIDGRVVPVEKLPGAAYVRIEPDEGGFLLLLFDDKGNGAGDEWCATLGEAKAQAKAEFEIQEADWSEVE